MGNNSVTQLSENFRIDAVDKTFGVIQAFLGTLSVILNITVLVGFVRIRSKIKSVHALYCTLAISDIVTGMTSVVYAVILLDKNLKLVHGANSHFNLEKLEQGFKLCVWMGPLFAFSILMTISLINAVTVCRTVAVLFPFYYKLYMRKTPVIIFIIVSAVHSIVVGCTPLLNDKHVYFLDAHSGTCAIMPLPGLNSLLKNLQLTLVTIPLSFYTFSIVSTTLIFLRALYNRRKSLSESSGLLPISNCCKKGSVTTKPIIVGKLSLGDKQSQKAERTVVCILASFLLTYTPWLIGFYCQVFHTARQKIPAAWFGITPHVSYYISIALDHSDDHSGKAAFQLTAYGPAALVILVLMNAVVNPLIHLVLNKELSNALLRWFKIQGEGTVVGNCTTITSAGRTSAASRDIRNHYYVQRDEAVEAREAATNEEAEFEMTAMKGSRSSVSDEKTVSKSEVH